MSFILNTMIFKKKLPLGARVEKQMLKIVRCYARRITGQRGIGNIVYKLYTSINKNRQLKYMARTNNINIKPAVQPNDKNIDRLVDSIEKLNDSINKMNKNNSYNNIITLFFPLIMLFVVIIQILITLVIPYNYSSTFGFVVFLLFIISLIIITKIIWRKKTII